MQNTKIKVKTIGHYHRDKDMKVELDLRPKRLNDNRRYIDYKEEHIPFVKVDIEVADAGAGEHKMESRLEYIKQRPWKAEDQPDFVTNKNRLKFIAAEDYENIEVQLNGIFYSVGAIFEHFLAAENPLENQEIGGHGTVRKAVFIADIPTSFDENSEKFKVMYAIDDKNEHVELKTVKHGMTFAFWTKLSSIAYWQAIFSNVSTMIIGSRTGTSESSDCNPPKNYPPYSLYQVRRVTHGLLPNRLNGNRRYFDIPALKVPHLNLNIEVTDSGAGELKMESLLEYIRQKGWPNGEKPNVVTNKQLLKCIASDDIDNIKIQIVQLGGVIFMLKSSENYTQNANFGKIFEHFMTKTTGDESIEEDEEVRKAVFIAEIPKDAGSDGKFKVMYSGEIDAIDDLKQHYELKVLSGGLNDYFWKNRSCSYYWQSVFSKVSTIIVGSRTGKCPNDYKTLPPFNLPEYSLYEVNKLEVQTMPMRAAIAVNNPKNKLYKNEPLPRNADWKVEACEEKLQQFLGLVSKTLKKNGDCFVFSKKKSDDSWTVIEIEQREAWFSSFVLNRLRFIASTSSTTSSETAGNTSMRPTSSNLEALLIRSMPIASITAPRRAPRKYLIPLSPEVIVNTTTTPAQEMTTMSKTEDKMTQTINETLSTMNLTEVLLTISTRPKSKIVFNAPFDRANVNRLEITNPSNAIIGLKIKSNIRYVEIHEMPFILKPTTSTILEMSFEADSYFKEMNKVCPDDQFSNNIMIEWINVSAHIDKESYLKLFATDGLFRRKYIRVEFNQ
ncbi:hypothetical protein GCK72_001629 [Caenorhabditis remanei]|uniref:Decapping nuclease n=1 Tax=Caenorhabditis remanei TaxID=31234 RepID=A0A6A5HVN1_CAERE|nr:hypothetical protein GCK72_001629 [Caenorhabditis remanei]KAF1769812.1 hypothetical protein GCK72_001629 [Caenorhabditis remanei]